MATLNAMFKILDGYSGPLIKVIKKSEEATTKILKASGATDTFNKKLEATGASANKGSNGLGKFASAAALVISTIKGMNIVDEFTNTSSRLALINDGLQTQAELQEKIFDAAYRSKGEYAGMASAISKMGLLASDQFGSNDELIAFTELLQKSFKVGGASTMEQSSAMLQLSQAMAAGKLQGDEFRSIMENAPLLAQAIANYTGKSKGELKELSSDGLITSDIIKNAMFMASDDINSKFATMPMTFSDIWNKIKNGALQAFDPVMKKVNELINTDGFQSFLNNIMIGINGIAFAFDLLLNVSSQLWGFLGPILSALGTTILISIIAKLWAMVPPLIAQAAAWLAIYWPILLVIAVVFLFVSALNYMGISTGQILGFIIGAFWGAYSFIYNIIALLVNAFMSFSDFIGNLFIDPVAAIKGLFYDMAITILGYFSTLASSLKELVNLIPGVEMNTSSGIEGMINSLKQSKSTLATDTGIKNSAKWQYKSAGTMAQTGYNFGNNIANGGFGALDTKGFDLSKFGTTNNPLKVEGTGNNGNVNVSMADEDIEYLKELAERDYINKFSTATLAPNVQVTFGDVHETADAYKVVKIIEKVLREEIAVVAEGVY